MAAFPLLKTSAVAQYPASKRVEYRNQVLHFVDGAGQRYRESAGPLRRWLIRLDQLDECEMASLYTFFQEQQGRAVSFSFTDPWDGRTYADCRFESDDLALMFAAEMRGQTSLTIAENRQ
ncbi:MAG TPA: DUF2460 domain-containing protein [Bryobacteraceae bacterium]|nr:DUF2460 domain-containing protein [Bryobacteraceae bacterium]